MRAVVLERPGTLLRSREFKQRSPAADEILIRAACGVCRTDLHIVDGELTTPKLPLVSGHETVGHVVAFGSHVDRFKVGQRVGIPWLGHMSDIPSFAYELLWRERVIRAGANLTRADGNEFLALAPKVPIRTEIQTFALSDANEALHSLRSGQLQGAAVLIP